MITEKQISQLQGLLAAIKEYEKPPIDDLIKSLNLPSWFDPDYCVIAMNKMYEETFKDHKVNWLYFTDHIPFNEMVVMDKRTTYTPMDTYPKKWGW